MVGTETPEPGGWEQGFPIPPRARRNESLGGATSLGPGRNYTLIVYDVGAGMETIVSFYGRHLPDATRSPEGEGVRFSTSRGYIRLAPSALGTRITLAVGPR